VCSRCSGTLERTINQTFNKENKVVEDSRPPADFHQKLHTFQYENGPFVFSLFSQKEVEPLTIRLNERLLPFVKLRKTKQAFSDDLKYHEILVGIVDARKIPSRSQVVDLSRRLMATTTNLLSLEILHSQRINDQYMNAEPHGFCSILSAEFMGEYAETGKWPKSLNTKVLNVKEKLLKSLSSVIDSGFRESSENEQIFVKKLTAMRDNVKKSIEENSRTVLTIHDNWLNVEELIFYFSKRFPGKQTVIFNYEPGQKTLKMRKSLYHAETCDHPHILNPANDFISFSALKHFLDHKTGIVLSSKHFWPFKLDGNFSDVTRILANQMSKHFIEESRKVEWPTPGSFYTNFFLRL
jgi:hypothetical protein